VGSLKVNNSTPHFKERAASEKVKEDVPYCEFPTYSDGSRMLALTYHHGGIFRPTVSLSDHHGQPSGEYTMTFHFLFSPPWGKNTTTYIPVAFFSIMALDSGSIYARHEASNSVLVLCFYN